MKTLFKSLADFQQSVEPIHKGTEGYGYSYASLGEIFEVINPLLKKNGLGFYQLIQGSQLETVIFHVESGEKIQSLTDIPQGVSLAKMNDFQVLGSAITYLRRYALSAALGLVTDKDTDAGGQQVKSATSAPPKNQSAPPQADTKWLNPNTKEWDAAIKFLANGGALPDIKKKYAISKVNEDKLVDEVLG